MSIGCGIVIFCFVLCIIVLTVGICVFIASWVWDMFKDLMSDVQQYKMKDRCINVREYELLMKNLDIVQETLDSVILRAMSRVSDEVDK